MRPQDVVALAPAKQSVTFKASWHDWLDVLLPFAACAAMIVLALRGATFGSGLAFVASCAPPMAAFFIALLSFQAVRRRLFGTQLHFYGPDAATITTGHGTVVARGTPAELGLDLRERDGEWFLCAKTLGPLCTRLDPHAHWAFQGLGVPKSSARIPSSTRSVRILVTLIIVGVSLGGMWIDWRKEQYRETPGQRTEGRFRLETSPNGVWNVDAWHCYSGRNQDTFQGVALALSAPLELVRFDEQRSPDAKITLQFKERNRGAVTVSERECRSVLGHTRVKALRVRERDLFFLEGEIQLDCPALGIRGSASYRGCLPSGY